MIVPANAIEVTCYFTWMGEDGIVRTKIKAGAEVNIAEAKENSEAVNSFYHGIKFPLLIDARGIKSMSKEARNHFTANGRETGAKAYAIIINSQLSRVIGNFFMGINKPAVPTRLFDNEKDAEIWLKKIA